MLLVPPQLPLQQVVLVLQLLLQVLAFGQHMELLITDSLLVLLVGLTLPISLLLKPLLLLQLFLHLLLSLQYQIIWP